MKTHLKILSTLLFCIILIGCSKDDTPTQDNGPSTLLTSDTGITEDDFSRYQGALGINISAREIAKTSNIPKTAVITSTYDDVDINQTIEIDEDLNVANLSFEIEALSENEREQLINGIPLSVSIRDAMGNEIGAKDFSIISFKSNPENEEIDALETITDQRDNVAFAPETQYFIQIIDPQQMNGDSAMFVNYSSNLETTVQQRNGYNFDSSADQAKLHLFRIHEIPSQPGVFAISANVTGSDPLLIKIFSDFLIQEDSINPETFNLDNIDDNTKFVFIRDKITGLFNIQPISNNVPLRKRIVSGSTRFNNLGDTTDDLLYVRILTTDIVWDTEEIGGTIFLDPILPPASTEISYNSKLSNCSQGPIEDQIGNEVVVSQSDSATIEESISMTSTQTQSLTASIETSAEASFFGTGFSVTAGLSSTLEQQQSITQTNTQSSSTTEENSLGVFSTRTITVPPGTAAIVNDTYQVYSNIKVPFIKRFRISGRDALTNNDLTGAEIATQYLISTGSKGGIIKEINDYSIDVTVRGVTNKAKEVQKTTRADDTDPECN